MGVGGDLLEKVALAGAARAKLDHVVVVLDERHHPQDQNVDVPLGHRIGLKAHAPQQKSLPIGGA